MTRPDPNRLDAALDGQPSEPAIPTRESWRWLKGINPRILRHSDDRRRADIEADPGYQPTRLDEVTGLPWEPTAWGIR
jgi:hypothetical protein